MLERPPAGELCLVRTSSVRGLTPGHSGVNAVEISGLTPWKSGVNAVEKVGLTPEVKRWAAGPIVAHVLRCMFNNPLRFRVESQFVIRREMIENGANLRD